MRDPGQPLDRDAAHRDRGRSGPAHPSRQPRGRTCLVEDPGHRALYIFNHFEYDSDTLKQEYDRDVADGRDINVPGNYYPDDDPTRPPQNRWRSHAHLLYGNWINQIYQTTPFDMHAIGR